MKKIETGLKDCYIIEPDKFGDERGYYSPFYIEEKNKMEGINLQGIVQGARSLSGKGIVRGLHYQEDPHCQAKLVECLSGAVEDIVVDLRKDSPTYMKSFHVLLTPENGRQLFVPRGFAHGFISLKENTLFQYLVDGDYKVYLEGGINCLDPQFGIPQLLSEHGIKNPIISEKDKERPMAGGGVLPCFYMHKRYLVTGVSGQLGFDVIRELNKRGIFDILALTSQEMDITDERVVNKIITEYKPDHIIHCAAYTKVDDAEKNKELAYKVNVEGTKNITNAARIIGAKLTYISTDYVFDGTKDGFYETTDETKPVNYYGETKCLGEEIVRTYNRHFIVRISWVFGINNKNFIKTMLNLSKTKEIISVVGDQIGSPTYTKDVAKLLIDMQDTEKYGTYHATNSGFTTWAELAEYAFHTLDVQTAKINRIATEEYKTIAKRPLNSKLSKRSLIENGFAPLEMWYDAVDEFTNELVETNDDCLVRNLNLK